MLQISLFSQITNSMPSESQIFIKLKKEKLSSIYTSPSKESVFWSVAVDEENAQPIFFYGTSTGYSLLN